MKNKLFFCGQKTTNTPANVVLVTHILMQQTYKHNVKKYKTNKLMNLF